MLDTIALSPVQAASNWLKNSLSEIANASNFLAVGLPAIMALLAAGLLAMASYI